MPNGKPGDHPLTDIVIHGASVYSSTADALVREIVQLGGRDRIERMLYVEYNTFNNPDIPKLERVLIEIRDELKRRKESK